MTKQKYVIQKELQGREGVISAISGYIRNLPEGIAFLVEIGRLKRERSNQQNKALFGHAYPIIMEVTGHDVNEIHDIMCGSFWGWKTIKVLGYTKQIPIRSTTKKEQGGRDVIKVDIFIKFFDFVQHKAAEYGILIPDPDPNWRRHMAEEAAKEKAKLEKEKAA